MLGITVDGQEHKKRGQKKAPIVKGLKKHRKGEEDKKQDQAKTQEEEEKERKIKEVEERTRIEEER